MSFKFFFGPVLAVLQVWYFDCSYSQMIILDVAAGYGPRVWGFKATGGHVSGVTWNIWSGDRDNPRSYMLRGPIQRIS